MATRFIARTVSFYGHWGAGETVDEAMANLRKQTRGHGGLKGKAIEVWKFTSRRPFAPSSREANDGECDCWIGRDGTMSWMRCERELVTTLPASSKASRAGA